MKILLFEWLSGGGLWYDDRPPTNRDPMLWQGCQMVSAVAEDLMAAGAEPIVPIDERMELNLCVAQVAVSQSPRHTLADIAAGVDAILIIAPETGGRLERCCTWLQTWRDKFISPDRKFVRLTADKNATCDYLQSAGIPVPHGHFLPQWPDAAAKASHPAPVVLKPSDGAGSEEVQHVCDWNEPRGIPRAAAGWRIEPYVAGRAVSVSALCGPERTELLAPTGQVFDRQPIGRYVGCQYPLGPEIAARATRLAERTIAALPSTIGYIGIDMVIGSRSSGDTVIEVNPRITVSYCRLREIYNNRLGRMMLRTCRRQSYSRAPVRRARE